MVEIDTAHFMGNFPESVELHALHSSEPTLPETEQEWTLILPRTKTGPHRRHFFQLEHAGQPWTHVRVTIHPDGGIKRVRLMGRRAEGTPVLAADLESANTPTPAGATALPQTGKPRRSVPILPLTPEAFSGFGQVVQAYADDNAAPRGTRITPANQGTARKYHKLSLLNASYPTDVKASAGLSVYRCMPLPVGKEWLVSTLERHAYTNQAFIPMGSVAEGEAGTENALVESGRAYLVVVAGTGPDGKPDLQTLRAFKASAAQGIVYNAAVWRK